MARESICETCSWSASLRKAARSSKGGPGAHRSGTPLKVANDVRVAGDRMPNVTEESELADEGFVVEKSMAR